MSPWWVTAGPQHTQLISELGHGRACLDHCAKGSGREHSAALPGSSGLFSLMQPFLVLRAQQALPEPTVPPCTCRPWALQPQPVNTLPGLLAASHSGDSLGGQLQAGGGFALPRQQHQVPQGLQKFPTRAFGPQELHISAWLLPGCCEGSPAQCSFAGLFPKARGVLGTVRAAGECQPSGVPLGEQEGSCPPKPD